jgi:hypothetical protein
MRNWQEAREKLNKATFLDAIWETSNSLDHTDTITYKELFDRSQKELEKLRQEQLKDKAYILQLQERNNHLEQFKPVNN